LADHRLEIDIDPRLPMLRLDYLLFEQALFNILDNAAKYAPPETLVRISAKAEAGSVAIRVEDEGPGIPPGDLERIFDKFYRVHAQDRQRAGTGLGLAICRGFVEAMGGTITAGNRASGGGVFTIRIPVSEAQAVTEARAHG
jgi:two-component system sensor histidine kinase KdpD